MLPKFTTVSDLGLQFVLVTDPGEIAHILENIGHPDLDEFGCLFVEEVDGDYKRIYGVSRSVPYNEARAYILHGCEPNSHKCSDCGALFDDAGERDKHFMTPACPKFQIYK